MTIRTTASVGLRKKQLGKKHGTTALVVNPTSASGSTGKDWDTQFTKIKQTFGENPEIVFTKKSGDGTSLTRDLLKKGFKRIIAIGGDGTINEVANGFFVSLDKQGRKANSRNQNRGQFYNPAALRPLNPES